MIERIDYDIGRSKGYAAQLNYVSVRSVAAPDNDA
jgi:hypothetical protein